VLSERGVLESSSFDYCTFAVTDVAAEREGERSLAPAGGDVDGDQQDHDPVEREERGSSRREDNLLIEHGRAPPRTSNSWVEEHRPCHADMISPFAALHEARSPGASELSILPTRPFELGLRTVVERAD